MQFPQRTAVNLSKIGEIKSSLAEDQNKIAGIIADNTSISKDEIQELFAQGESKSLNFAKDKGFITEVKSIKLAPEDILINIAFQNKT